MTGHGDRPTAQRWVHRPDVHAVELDGETVVYDRPTRRLHLLNPSATVIWMALDGQVTGDELVAELAEQFGVELETMDRQVRDVLTTLSQEGLIQAS